MSEETKMEEQVDQFGPRESAEETTNQQQEQNGFPIEFGKKIFAETMKNILESEGVKIKDVFEEIDLVNKKESRLSSRQRLMISYCAEAWKHITKDKERVTINDITQMALAFKFQFANQSQLANIAMNMAQQTLGGRKLTWEEPPKQEEEKEMLPDPPKEIIIK